MSLSLRTRARVSRPSFGFFFLFGSHLLLVSLLWWGWQKPPLDEAFEILARRELGGTVEFSPGDVKVLQQVWDAHPGFSRALLGKSTTVRFLEPTESGWLARSSAHLTVRPELDRPTQFTVEGRGTPSDYPIVVKIYGKGIARQVDLASNQPQTVEFPSNGLKQPRILDVELTAGQSHSAGAPTWAVRVVSSSASTARETP